MNLGVFQYPPVLFRFVSTSIYMHYLFSLPLFFFNLYNLYKY